MTDSQVGIRSVPMGVSRVQFLRRAKKASSSVRALEGKLYFSFLLPFPCWVSLVLVTTTKSVRGWLCDDWQGFQNARSEIILVSLSPFHSLSPSMEPEVFGGRITVKVECNRSVIFFHRFSLSRLFAVKSSRVLLCLPLFIALLFVYHKLFSVSLFSRLHHELFALFLSSYFFCLLRFRHVFWLAHSHTYTSTCFHRQLAEFRRAERRGREHDVLVVDQSLSLSLPQRDFGLFCSEATTSGVRRTESSTFFFFSYTTIMTTIIMCEYQVFTR